MATESQKMVDISQRVPSPLGKVLSECEADEVSLLAICDCSPTRGRVKKSDSNFPRTLVRLRGTDGTFEFA